MYKNKRCLNVEILLIFLLVFLIKICPVFSQTSQDFFYDSNLGSIKKSNPNSPSNQLNLKQSDISNYANFIGYSYKEAKIDYNFSFPSYNSQSLSQSHFHPTTTNNFHGYNYSAATAFLNPLFNLGFLVTLANNNNYILPAASLAFLALSFGAFVTANDVFNVIRNFESDKSDYFNDNLSVHEMDLDYDPKQDESPKIFVDNIDKDSKNRFEKIINNSSEVIIMQKMDYLLSKLFNSSSTANDNDNLKILLFRALKLSDKELKNRLLQIASLDVVTQFSDYMDYHDHISQANIDMWNQEVFYKFLTTQITTVSSLHIFLARMMKLDESLSDEYLLLKYNLGDTESAESSMFITGTINRLFDYLSSFDPVNYQVRYGPKLTRNDSYERIKIVLLNIDPTELKTRLSYNIKKYYEIDYQYLVKSKKLKLVNAESLISYLDTIDHKMRLFFLITALNLIEHVEVEKLFDDGQNLFSDDFDNDFIYQFIEYYSLGYIPQIKNLNKDNPAFMALAHKFENLSDEELVDLVKSSRLFEFISYDDLWLNSELIRQFVKTKLNDDQIKLHIFFSAFLNLASFKPGIIAKIYRLQVKYVHQIKKNIFIDFHLFVKDYDELSIYLIEFLYFINVKKTENLKDFIQNKKFFEHEETKKYFKPRYIKNYIKFLAKSNDRLKLALFIKFLFGDNVLSADLSSLINYHYPDHGYKSKQLIDLFSKGLFDEMTKYNEDNDSKLLISIKAKDLNKDDQAFIALANKFENLSDEKLVYLVKSSKLLEFISYDDLWLNSELIRQFVKTKLNDEQIKLHIFFGAFLNLTPFTFKPNAIANFYSIDLVQVSQIKKDIFIDFHLFIKDHDKLSRYFIEFLYFISTKYTTNTKYLNGFIQNKEFFEHEETKKYLKTGYIKNYIKFLVKSNDRLKLALFIKFIFGQRFLGTDISSLIKDYYPNHGYSQKQLTDLFSKDLKDLNNDSAFIASAHKFENLSDEKLIDLVKSSKLFEFISYDDLSVDSQLIRQFVKTQLNDDRIKLHIFFSAFLNLTSFKPNDIAKTYSIGIVQVYQIKKDIFMDFHLFIKDHDKLSRYLIEFLYFISTKYTTNTKYSNSFIQNKEFFEHEEIKKYLNTRHIKNYIKFLAKSNDRLKLALFVKLFFGQKFLGGDLSSLIKDHYPDHGYDNKDNSQLIDLFLDDFVQSSYKFNQKRAYKRHNKQDIDKELEVYDIKRLENLFKNISKKDLLEKVSQSYFTKDFDNLAKIKPKLIHNYLDSIKSKPIKYYLFLSEIFQRDIPLTIVIKHLNISQKNIANARFNMKKNFQDYININSLSPADFNDRFYKLSDDELIFLFNKNIMKNTEASNNLTDIKDFYESIAKSDVKAYLFLHLLFNGTISKKDYGYIGKKYSHYSNYLKKIVDNLISDYQIFLNNIDI